MKNSLTAFFILFSLFITAQTTVAQAPRTTPAAPAAAPKTPKVEAFLKIFNFYAAQMEKAQSALVEIQKPETTAARRAELEPILEDISEKISKVYPQMMKAAEAAWLESPGAVPELDFFIAQVLENRLMSDNYERAYALLVGMLKGDFPQKLPEVYDVAAETCFMLNQYDAADKFFKMAEQKKVLSDKGAAWQKLLQYYRVAWAKEKTLRDRETQANDLPRVVLETTKGNITLELFENEAPNTVANFIFLVEKKFYDGSPFHSVIPSFVAQAGSSAKTGEPGPGHRIACEADKPGARKHFRGSVSMALSGKDTGGSQFFICFTPLQDLDSVNTVFGRVVDGWDVLSELTRINANNPDPLAEPDIITSATVLRKRDHVYKPKAISDSAKTTTSTSKTPAKKPDGPSAY